MKATRISKIFRLWFAVLITLFAFSCEQASDAGGSVRHLSEFAGFDIYSETGTWEWLASDGTVEKSGESVDFANGELRFLVTSETEGLIMGSLGVGRVALNKSDDSWRWIETTESGSQHVLTVYDRWDSAKSGFPFTYVRHTTSLFSGPSRSAYTGVAKPVGFQ